MRILFVLEHFYPYIGGVETLFLELSTSLVRQGHHVGVVTTQYHPDLSPHESLNGVEVYRIPCKNRFLFSFLSIPVIIKLTGNYDLIQTTSYNAAFPAWIAGLIKRKSVVITFHEVWGKLWWELPFISWPLRLGFFLWEQLVLRLPYAKIIAVSESTRQSLMQAGIHSNKVVLIYNGLDYSEFESYVWEPPAQFTYIYFGRLGTSKGLELLLPAAALFALAHPESQFKLIIPTYPVALYNWVISFIKTRKLEQHISLMHDLPRKELFLEVCHSSCVVIPSYSEGFCFVAAEVVALGVPIISSQRKALHEVTSGKLVTIAPLDTDGVYRALEKAYDGDWSEIKPVRFDLKDAVAAYERLYRSLL